MVHTTHWGFLTPQHMQQHPESMTTQECELEDEEFFAWYAEEELTRRVSPVPRPTPTGPVQTSSAHCDGRAGAPAVPSGCCACVTLPAEVVPQRRWCDRPVPLTLTRPHPLTPLSSPAGLIGGGSWQRKPDRSDPAAAHAGRGSSGRAAAGPAAAGVRRRLLAAPVARAGPAGGSPRLRGRRRPSGSGRRHCASSAARCRGSAARQPVVCPLLGTALLRATGRRPRGCHPGRRAAGQCQRGGWCGGVAPLCARCLLARCVPAYPYPACPYLPYQQCMHSMPVARPARA